VIPPAPHALYLLLLSIALSVLISILLQSSLREICMDPVRRALRLPVLVKEVMPMMAFACISALKIYMLNRGLLILLIMNSLMIGFVFSFRIVSLRCMFIRLVMAKSIAWMVFFFYVFFVNFVWLACPNTIESEATCEVVQGTACTVDTNMHVYDSFDAEVFACETASAYTCATTQGEEVVEIITVDTCYLDGLCPTDAKYITMTAAPPNWDLTFVGSCEAECEEDKYVYHNLAFTLCLDCKI
jgi:hypothetical protein